MARLPFLGYRGPADHGSSPRPALSALTLLFFLFYAAGCDSTDSRPTEGSGGTTGIAGSSWAGYGGTGYGGSGYGGYGYGGYGGAGIGNAGSGGAGNGGAGVAGSMIADSGVFDSGAAGFGGAGSGGSTGTGGTAGSAGSCGPFSFFVTSLVAMRRESGSENGFGGDLGGLAGADELCRRIAEYSLPCAGNKVWRAFLSTSTEDAIDRVGTGPWYDRLGRTVALTVSDLANTRPANADPAIANDLPNEDGVPNHAPDGTQVDNHDTLTGSDEQGRYVGSAQGTCNDWTSTGSGRPGIGHSWPGGPSPHWIAAHTAPGCAPGVNLSQQGGGGRGESSVGAGGGYGGIYCFALTP